MSNLNSYFAESSSGHHLELNEDSLVIDVPNGLFGVIDGYGGSGIGDKVSMMIQKTITESYGILSFDEDATLPLYFNPNYRIETNALINSMKLAHAKVKEINNGKDTSARGGASFLGCAPGSNSLQLVGTGNCLALTKRGDEIIVSYFPHCQGEIKLTGQSNALSFPKSGIGLYDELQFFVQEVKINTGDKLFLMSSGSYAPFNLTELAILIREFGDNPKELKNEIFQLSESRGSKANQSIVCLEF